MNKKNVLKFEASCTHENTTYVSLSYINALISVDLINGNVRYLNSFPGELKLKRRLHYCTMLIDDCIIFFPFQSNKIQLYNFEKNYFRTICIPVEGDVFFTNAIIYGEYIYLTSTRNQDIWLFSLKEEKIEKIFFGDKNCYFSLGTVHHQKFMYTLFPGKNILYKYNLDEKIIELVNINNYKGFSHIIGLFDDKIFLHEQDSDNVVSYNLNTKDIIFEFKILTNRIMTAYQSGHNVLTYNEYDNSVMKIDLIKKSAKILVSNSYYAGAIKKESKVYYIVDNTVKNLDDKCIICDLKYDENSIENLRMEIVNYNRIGSDFIQEEGILNLELFLKMLERR